MAMAVAVAKARGKAQGNVEGGGGWTPSPPPAHSVRRPPPPRRTFHKRLKSSSFLDFATLAFAGLPPLPRLLLAVPYQAHARNATVRETRVRSSGPGERHQERGVLDFGGGDGEGGAFGP